MPLLKWLALGDAANQPGDSGHNYGTSEMSLFILLKARYRRTHYSRQGAALQKYSSPRTPRVEECHDGFWPYASAVI
jgi:hypothetical protein